jgi:hypothetical protein
MFEIHIFDLFCSEQQGQHAELDVCNIKVSHYILERFSLPLLKARATGWLYHGCELVVLLATSFS